MYRGKKEPLKPLGAVWCFLCFKEHDREDCRLKQSAAEAFSFSISSQRCHICSRIVIFFFRDGFCYLKPHIACEGWWCLGCVVLWLIMWVMWWNIWKRFFFFHVSVLEKKAELYNLATGCRDTGGLSFSQTQPAKHNIVRNFMFLSPSSP